MQKKKKPKFKRQESARYKKLGDKWRKPRGIHSKLRKGKRGKGVKPSIGYGNPERIRGVHPSGFREVLISNPSKLDDIDPKTQAVRIAGKVGKRKRGEILKKARKLKLKVLNTGGKS
ncbi:MAG: 50S ribosomal protein L32e [Candidatus Hydrothermarchaeales archaeon]